MNPELDLIETVKVNIERRGRDAVKKAQEAILSTQHGEVISEALKHFATVTLKGGLPVFPALISMSREAVDGKTEKTAEIGSAMTLIAGAADIHDDIIDKSSIKYSKRTVFGKFGAETALLAGDVLLVQGLTLLQECKNLSREQRSAIFSLILGAMYEIGNAEATETRFMRRTDITPEEFMEVIRMKAVVPEVHCKIGGILGHAKEETLMSLGNYGRNFGTASIIRDEFLDLMDYQELQSRLKNECLPLPILYALKNPVIKQRIAAFTQKKRLTKKDFEELSSIVLDSDEARQLRYVTYSVVADVAGQQPFNSDSVLGKEAALLLKAATEGI